MVKTGLFTNGVSTTIVKVASEGNNIPSELVDGVKTSISTPLTPEQEAVLPGAIASLHSSLNKLGISGGMDTENPALNSIPNANKGKGPEIA